MGKIRILIADDQALVRDGLKTILDLEEELEVIEAVGDGLEAYQLTKELKPDIVLMDVRMPKMDGIESTKKIKESNLEPKILALTTFDDREYIVEILNYGAEGYLLKDIGSEELVEAIRDAYQGELVMPAEIAQKLAQFDKEKQQQENEELELSELKMEVAFMLANGFTNKQIAAKLNISYGTVKNYVSHIYNEIGINDRTKAALYLNEHFFN